MRKRAEIISVI